MLRKVGNATFFHATLNFAEHKTQIRYHWMPMWWNIVECRANVCSAKENYIVQLTMGSVLKRLQKHCFKQYQHSIVWNIWLQIINFHCKSVYYINLLPFSSLHHIRLHDSKYIVVFISLVFFPLTADTQSVKAKYSRI